MFVGIVGTHLVDAVDAVPDCAVEIRALKLETVYFSHLSLDQTDLKQFSV